MKTDAELRQTIADCRRQLRERSRKRKRLPKRPKGKMCRPVDRDEEAKARRGYVEAASYVRLDGSEVLKGEDWRNRKAELRARSGGRCEHLCDGAYRRLLNMADITYDPLGQIRCTKPATDPHHTIRRSVLRDDRLASLQHLCRFHHDLLDPRKTRFGESRKAEA